MYVVRLLRKVIQTFIYGLQLKNQQAIKLYNNYGFIQMQRKSRFKPYGFPTGRAKVNESIKLTSVMRWTLLAGVTMRQFHGLKDLNHKIVGASKCKIVNLSQLIWQRMFFRSVF